MSASVKLGSMSIAYRSRLSLAEFLAWEEREDLRYEFDGFQAVAMTGGTRAHAAIQGNIAVAIRGRLRGTPCQFYGSDLKIEVAGRIRYPDGFVVCIGGDPKDKIVREPVVIFEVLSESTASTDIITKNGEYAATPSVIRYIILSQDEIAATMFERKEGDWITHVLGADAVIAMPEIGIDVPLAEFYADVAFEERLSGLPTNPIGGL